MIMIIAHFVAQICEATPMFNKKRFLTRQNIKERQSVVLPETHKSIKKTYTEFRLEAYKLWLSIMEKEISLRAVSDDIMLAFDSDNLFYLISPRNKVIPLSWAEISVLEEYMANYVEKFDKPLDSADMRGKPNGT
jgi:hypothetical protein